MSGRLARHAALLAGLARKGRARTLAARAGLDFASNDYLGLAASPRLAAALREAIARNVPHGAGGSRLLRGNHAEHEALEAEAAAFFRAPACLLLGSGYAGNTALYSALPQRGDLVLHDELVHASAHDGMRLGKAEARPFAHNDANAAEDAIRAWRGDGGTGRIWLGVESLYSMDGDRAPLSDLAAIADRHEAFLLMDEAHATGLFGPNGRGLAAYLEGRENVVVLHTGGKALGVSGALVAADRVLIDMLINRARPFIYATAPSPLVAAALREALRILADEPERRDALAALVRRAEARLAALGLPASGSQILPVILGTNARAMHIAEALQAAGFDCRAIRPPTVPEGTARLRLSVTLNVDAAGIDAMASALGQALAEAA